MNCYKLIANLHWINSNLILIIYTRFYTNKIIFYLFNWMFISLDSIIKRQFIVSVTRRSLYLWFLLFFSRSYDFSPDIVCGVFVLWSSFRRYLKWFKFTIIIATVSITKLRSKTENSKQRYCFQFTLIYDMDGNKLGGPARVSHCW